MARIYTKNEMKKRKLTMRAFAGVFDFVGTAVAIFVALGCIVLIGSMLKWVKNDVPTTFKDITNLAEMALSLDEKEPQEQE